MFYDLLVILKVRATTVELFPRQKRNLPWQIALLSWKEDEMFLIDIYYIPV